MKAGGEDPHDLVALTVDGKCSTYNLGIGRIVTAPEFVADYHDVIAPWNVFVVEKDTASCGRTPSNGKKSGETRAAGRRSGSLKSVTLTFPPPISAMPSNDLAPLRHS